MPEIPLPEDEAGRYVLGEMTPAERRGFEARLEKSDELRALVRDLEAGAVAAALASPQRSLPPSLWAQIQSDVTEEAKRAATAPAFWRVVRGQAGWWAAAACLVGWLLYAFWVHRTQVPGKSAAALSENNSAIEHITAESSRRELSRATPPLPGVTNSIRPQLKLDPLVQTAEIAALRRQVRALETQVSQMSQAMTQQQALPVEAAQFTFFQLAPRGPNGDPLRVAAPSVDLQRALFFAMARELGWLGAKDVASPSGAGQDSKTGASDSTTAEPQIVYLTPPGTESPHHTSDGNENLTAQGGKSTGDDTTLAGSGIPMVKSGTNVFMAFDPSIFPVGSSLTISNGNQLIGSIAMGDGPTVVGFSSGDPRGSALNLAVTSGTGGAWVSTTNAQPGSPPH